MLVNAFCRFGAGCLLLGLALAMFLTGCGGGAEEGTVAVEGTVMVDGKPIAQASVAFIGKEGARLASASTNAAGKFNLRASPGKNVVTVAKAPPGGPAPPPSDEPQLMPTEGEYAKMQKAAAASEVPAKYGDPKTSGLSFDIAEKTPPIELSLSSK